MKKARFCQFHYMSLQVLQPRKVLIQYRIRDPISVPSTVVEGLPPKAIKLDYDGVPISKRDVVTVGKKQPDVETIDWEKCRSSQRLAHRITNAKSLVASSVWAVNQKVIKHPVAIIRKGHNAFPEATHTIAI